MKKILNYFAFYLATFFFLTGEAFSDACIKTTITCSSNTECWAQLSCRSGKCSACTQQKGCGGSTVSCNNDNDCKNIYDKDRGPMCINGKCAYGGYSDCHKS